MAQATLALLDDSDEQPRIRIFRYQGQRGRFPVPGYYWRCNRPAGFVDTETREPTRLVWPANARIEYGTGIDALRRMLRRAFPGAEITETWKAGR